MLQTGPNLKARDKMRALCLPRGMTPPKWRNTFSCVKKSVNKLEIKIPHFLNHEGYKSKKNRVFKKIIVL